jgi:O-antigen/teichoic acid export membrane protein
MPLNLAVVALLTRQLIPEEMGVYFLAFSLVTTASSLGMLGMGDTMVRLVASSLAVNDTNTARRAIKESFLWGSLGSLIAAVILALIGDEFGLPGNVVGLVALWGIFQTGQNLLAEALRGFNEIRSATVFQNRSFSNALVAIGLIVAWIVQVELNLTLVFAAFCAVSFLAVVFGLVLLWWKVRKEAPSQPSPTKEEPLGIFSQALPVFGVSSMNSIRAQIGLWIVAALLTSEEIALYGSANRLVYLVSIPLSTVVNALIPPIIAELYAKGEIRRLERAVRTLATFATIPALLLTTAFVIGGPLILRFIYGEFYTGAATVLAILAVTHFIGVAGGSCGVTLVMTNNQKTLFLITIVTATTAVALTALGANLFGMVGVAIATLLVILLQNVLMVVGVKRTVGIWTHLKLSWK